MQFTMLVILNFVTIFLSVALHQQVGRKRRDDECFLDWFSWRTSSESLGYNSFLQKDILHAFSKKMNATKVLNEDQRK